MSDQSERALALEAALKENYQARDLMWMNILKAKTQEIEERERALALAQQVHEHCADGYFNMAADLILLALDDARRAGKAAQVRAQNDEKMAEQ